VVQQKTGTIHIKWVRSGIALPRRQRAMVASLGLTRLNQVVERLDTVEVRGVVAKVPHLLRVVPAPAPPSLAAIPEYVVVPAEAPPKAKKKISKPLDAAPGAVAAKTPEVDGEKAEGSAPRKKAGARKAAASASEKKSTSKGQQEEKPRKRRVVEAKESKSAKKGTK